MKRLDDPAQRAGAIKRLTQFFEDDMTKANKNRDDPSVKALLDDIVDPMTKQYVAATLDEKTRKDLMKFLADTRDPRTGPALAKAFNEYEPGKNEEDVKYAAKAVQGLAEAKKLTDQTVKDALWNCFDKFQVSKTKMFELVKALHDAVVAVADPSYGAKAVGKLNAAVDPKNVDSVRDQLQFWQLTSAQLVGDLKYAPAAKPLVTILLTPTRKKGSQRHGEQRAPQDGEGRRARPHRRAERVRQGLRDARGDRHEQELRGRPGRYAR